MAGSRYAWAGNVFPISGKSTDFAPEVVIIFPIFPNLRLRAPVPNLGAFANMAGEHFHMAGRRVACPGNVTHGRKTLSRLRKTRLIFRPDGSFSEIPPNLGFWALPLNSGALANATGVHFLLTAKRFARPGKVTHCLGAFLRFRKARQTSRPEGLFVTRFAQIQAYGATLRSLGALAKMDGRHFHVAGKRFAWPENDTHGRKTVPPMLGSAADFATGVVIYFPDFTQFKLTGHYPKIWAHRPTWPGGHFHLVGKRPRVAGKRYTWAGNVCHISGNRQTSRHIWLFISPISPKFGRTDHHCRGGVSTWSGNAPHGR